MGDGGWLRDVTRGEHNDNQCRLSLNTAVAYKSKAVSQSASQSCSSMQQVIVFVRLRLFCRKERKERVIIGVCDEMHGHC